MKLPLSRLSPRDRRTVLLGTLVVLLAAGWRLGVQPYRAALLGTREQVTLERALLARERALLAQRDELPARLALARRRAAHATDRLISGENAPLEEAELTQQLEGMASLSSVLLTEIRSLGAEPGDSARFIRPLRMALRGESDFEGVLLFVQRLESHPLALRITELSIEPQLERGGNGAAAKPTAVLDLAVVVEAYTAEREEDQ